MRSRGDELQADWREPSLAEPSADHQRLGTRDVMILIAATAVGLAWTRSYALDYLLPFLAKKGALPQRYQLVWILAAVPMLTSWCVGLFLFQAIRPGSRAIELARRPGAVACGIVGLTATLDIFLIALVKTVSLTIPGWRGTYGIMEPFPVAYLLAWNMPEAGVAVAAAWILMYWVRSSGPEFTFVEGVSQACGWIWIILFVAKTAYFFSMMM